MHKPPILKVVNTPGYSHVSSISLERRRRLILADSLKQYHKHDRGINSHPLICRLYNHSAVMKVSRREAYLMILSLVYCLSRSHSGLKNARLRRVIKSVVSAYVSSADDPETARALIRDTEAKTKL